MSNCKDVINLDIEVAKDNYKDKVYDILIKLRPGWTKDEIKFREIAQGIVNLMVVCYVSEDCKDAVVVRVFGSLLASVVDRNQEIKVSRLLSEIGLGAPLLAVFRNGLCSGCIQGKGFSWADAADFRDINLGKKIAKTLAAVHSKKTTKLAREAGIGKGSDFMELCAKAIDRWPIPFEDKELTDWFYKQTPPADLLRAEFAISQQVVAEIKTAETLCHGDLNPTNLMMEDGTGAIRLVDFECAGLNSPLYDLSLFFVTSAAGPLATDLEKSQHTPEYHRAFIRAYLEELKRLDDEKDDVTDEEVERYYAMVDKLTIAMQYIGLILGASYFADNPNLTVAGMDFKMIFTPMLTRWDYYLKHKERMLSIKI